MLRIVGTEPGVGPNPVYRDYPVRLLRGADTKIQAMVFVKEFPADQYLLFCTRNGTVKKTALSEYSNPRSTGIKAIKIEDGLITAAFSDGTIQALGKLLIATFSNPDGLRERGDGRWSVTGDSGPAIVGEAGSDAFGRIQSGALERANVDITEELVALIAAQRNFQANAKAIETANSMAQSIINLRS